MTRRICALFPAVAFGFFWGCGDSQTSGNADGLTGASGTGTRGAQGNAGTSSTNSNGYGGNRIDFGIGGATAACPNSCLELNADCGAVTDARCGGVVQCGTCASGQICGAAGPNRCGNGDIACTPKTCAELGANCGAAGDGCGNLLDCGSSCPSGQVCGALTPNQCGAGASCKPLTCADLVGVECGQQGDGCGAAIDCGACPTGQQCISQTDGKAKCVGATCVRKTCAELGVECGSAGDGCGGILDCNAGTQGCVAPKACGGDPMKPGKCGCTGVCSQIPDCAAGKTTSISGTVYDPGGRTPLYDALVYIPNNPLDLGLKPFATRSNTCDVCGATAAGDPLVSTKTGVDGSFKLENVPVGQAITLVVQLGRWRRIFEIDIATACESNPLPNAGKLTLPKNKSEGDIPLIAAVTGAADGMECMLWKAGIDTAEFTNPGGTGRVHLYRGSGQAGNGAGPGTKIDADTPSETALYVKDANNHIPLTDYDMLILACQGSDYSRSTVKQPSLAYWSDLVNYANSGGRVFATHWSHSYMRIGGSSNPLSTTATWRSPADADYPTTYTGTVVNDSARNPRQAEFNAWLALVGALKTPVTTPATFDMWEPRFDVSKVTAPGQIWVTAPRPKTTTHLPLHYTFNTPVSDGTGKSCGKFVYSDFHVSKGDETKNFPANCGSWDTFTAQEKVLEFMLFDLSSCVTPYVPLCTPKTCADQGYECGKAGDGCGNAIDCGTCTANEVCGLISPGKCDPFTCAPKTCSNLGYECGLAGDGCGSAIDCGPCPPGQTCGAAGPYKCGTASCTPTTCAQQGLECGAAGDGCGNALDCGTCVAPEVCGVGGPGICGVPSCTPKTCAEQGIECGAAGDGCGAALNCGNCDTGMVCGGITPGQCSAVLL